jgi:DNA-binding response OmpR family regulator
MPSSSLSSLPSAKATANNGNAAAAGHLHSSSPPSAGADTNCPRILVVDDEYDIARVVKMALEKYRYRVDAFSDPVKALEHFEKDPAYYDLAIVDIRMPGMTGYKLTSCMRQQSRTIKLVLMMAFDIDGQVQREVLPSIGVDAVLKKPFAITEICKVIEQELAKARKGQSMSKESI